ncbi:hypothetical protein HBA55_34625 [Pseudomaricurvus alkylphenolicus]|uniref:phage tail-collar fiber domain-containing protein n=1 Tax=Pseudomaricurvus alkylphenolicus TaxID=1306991 RepID=UPI00142250F3|nr:phage tail protein [Pseudomaricurvus alkylphenolicus]NIB44767.1 hypothetical protein [Pseudomaricurvus alkylphenolicus]
MSSVITTAGESLIASAQAGQLAIDKFVLANVPGLDPAAAIDREAGLPPVGEQVYEAPVTAAGLINSNTVAYSLVMGSDIGDFDFNYMALVTDGGQVFAVSTFPLLSKLQGDGYNMNRNFAVSFSGAKEATGINISAQSWQIDYSVRLRSMDARTTHHANDWFGVESFFNDGFEITESAGVYTLAAGFGYVNGVRIDNEADQVVTVPATPNSVWLDVALVEDFSGLRPTFTVVVSTDPQTDYVDENGKQHYLRKIADISAGGSVTDTRQYFDAVDENGLARYLYRAKQFLVTTPVINGDIDEKYGETITLSVGGSVSAWDSTDHDTQIAYYEWTLPDDSTQQGTSVNWSIPNDVGLVGEFLAFEVVAVDELGHRSDAAKHSVEIASNKAPRMNDFAHTVPVAMVRDDVVAVNFSGAIDPDGSQSLLTYSVVETVSVSASKTSAIASGENINLTVDSIAADQAGSVTVKAIDEAGRESKHVVINFQLLYDPFINTPVLLAPEDNTTGVGSVLTMVAGSFATTPSARDTHQSTDWRITDDQDAVVWEVLGETTDKLMKTVPFGELEVSTNYKAKVRFNGATYQSEWTEASFVTKDQFNLASEQAQLTESGQGNYGYGVAISGDGSTFMVSASTTSSSQGRVWAYDYDNGVYGPGFEMVPNDIANSDNFGSSVAISENGLIAVIGSPNDGNDGSAYVFSKEGGFWTQVAKLVPDTDAESFGAAAAISDDGSVIAVGDNADKDPNTTIMCGAAHIFRRNGGNNWQLEQKFKPDVETATAYFGYAIDVSGDGEVLVVGALNDDGGATDSGAVYVYEHQGGGVWSGEIKLTSVDSSNGDDFGHAVAISGDGLEILIGAPRCAAPETQSGAVYVFRKTGGSWGITTKIPNVDPGDKTDTEYGYSVDIAKDGSVALIGSRDVDSGKGAVYTFIKDNGMWKHDVKLIASDGSSNYKFGVSCCIGSDGKSALIGANGNQKGYVFR